MGQEAEEKDPSDGESEGPEETEPEEKEPEAEMEPSDPAAQMIDVHPFAAALLDSQPLKPREGAGPRARARSKADGLPRASSRRHREGELPATAPGARTGSSGSSSSMASSANASALSLLQGVGRRLLGKACKHSGKAAARSAKQSGTTPQNG